MELQSHLQLQVKVETDLHHLKKGLLPVAVTVADLIN